MKLICPITKNGKPSCNIAEERICEICGKKNTKWLICNKCKDEFIEENNKNWVYKIREEINDTMNLLVFNRDFPKKYNKRIIDVLAELERTLVSNHSQHTDKALIGTVKYVMGSEW